MSNPTVPAAQTLLNSAQQFYNLPEALQLAIGAGAVAAANNGTPLPPNGTSNELLALIGGTMQRYTTSQLFSILAQQFLTFFQSNATLSGSLALSGTVPVDGVGGGAITVPGAEIGDFVQVSTNGALGVGVYQIDGRVTVANTVFVLIWNPPGSLSFTLNLTGKTAYVRVTKRVS